MAWAYLKLHCQSLARFCRSSIEVWKAAEDKWIAFFVIFCKTAFDIRKAVYRVNHHWFLSEDSFSSKENHVYFRCATSGTAMTLHVNIMNNKSVSTRLIKFTWAVHYLKCLFWHPTQQDIPFKLSLPGDMTFFVCNDCFKMHFEKLWNTYKLLWASYE